MGYYSNSVFVVVLKLELTSFNLYIIKVLPISTNTIGIQLVLLRVTHSLPQRASYERYM